MDKSFLGYLWLSKYLSYNKIRTFTEIVQLFSMRAIKMVIPQTWKRIVNTIIFYDQGYLNYN